MVRRDLVISDVLHDFLLKSTGRLCIVGKKGSKLAGLQNIDQLPWSDDIADPQADKHVEKRKVHLYQLDVDGTDFSFVSKGLDYPFAQHIDMLFVVEEKNHMRDDQRMLVPVRKDALDAL